MFGFPTRSRYLFHADPRRAVEWPPEETIDRDLDIAISQFAPGSETVKDGIVHTAVGVVRYRRDGQRIRQLSNPLGTAIPLGTCRKCQAVVFRPQPQLVVCPICSSSEFQITQLSQPAGFTTLFNANWDFDGVFEWTPRASHPKTNAEILDMKNVANCDYLSREAEEVCVVNDNAGRLFSFRKLAGSETWITQDALDYVVDQLLQRHLTPIQRPQFDQSIQPDERALGSIIKTDILVLGLHSIRPEIDLSPLRVEGRAALYSFGFLLRRAAAAASRCQRTGIAYWTSCNGECGGPASRSSLPF